MPFYHRQLMSTNSLFVSQIAELGLPKGNQDTLSQSFFKIRFQITKKHRRKESASLNLVNNLESARRLSGIKTNTQARKRVTVYFSYDLVQPVVKNGRNWLLSKVTGKVKI